MNKAQREQKIEMMLAIICKDFNKMLELTTPGFVLSSAAKRSKAYLERQIDKYLKPLTRAEFRAMVDKRLMVALQADLLLNSPDDAGAIPYKRPNWDTEGDGPNGPEHVNWKLKMGGGWAVKGSFGGEKIRINQKAFWMFPQLTLRGVMVHEATHFALDTEDIHYSTFTRNSVMKALDNGSENADNWRIFYQKMSTHLASGKID